MIPAPKFAQPRSSQHKMRVKNYHDYSLTRYKAVENSLNKLRSQKSTVGKLGQNAARLTKLFSTALHETPDEYVLEFNLDMQRDRIAQHKLSPEAMRFAKPDFGFNDGLMFSTEEEDSENMWIKFLDCFSLTPKYERVKNYVDFIHSKKI